MRYYKRFIIKRACGDHIWVLQTRSTKRGTRESVHTCEVRVLPGLGSVVPVCYMDPPLFMRDAYRALLLHRLDNSTFQGVAVVGETSYSFLNINPYVRSDEPPPLRTMNDRGHRAISLPQEDGTLILRVVPSTFEKGEESLHFHRVVHSRGESRRALTFKHAGKGSVTPKRVEELPSGYTIPNSVIQQLSWIGTVPRTYSKVHRLDFRSPMIETMGPFQIQHFTRIMREFWEAEDFTRALKRTKISTGTQHSGTGPDEGTPGPTPRKIVLQASSSAHGVSAVATPVSVPKQEEVQIDDSTYQPPDREGNRIKATLNHMNRTLEVPESLKNCPPVTLKPGSTPKCFQVPYPLNSVHEVKIPPSLHLDKNTYTTLQNTATPRRAPPGSPESADLAVPETAPATTPEADPAPPADSTSQANQTGQAEQANPATQADQANQADPVDLSSKAGPSSQATHPPPIKAESDPLEIPTDPRQARTLSPPNPPPSFPCGCLKACPKCGGLIEDKSLRCCGLDLSANYNLRPSTTEKTLKHKKAINVVDPGWPSMGQINCPYHTMTR